MPPSRISVSTATVETYDPQVLSQGTTTIANGQAVDIDGATYICKNKREGCCQEQAYTIGSTAADCWTLKPTAKSADQLTTEYQEKLDAGDLDSCIWWTSGYLWLTNEQSCGGKVDTEVMFKCLLPEWCMLIEPQDYDLAGYYDVDESTVWEQSLKVLVESTPSDAENCYSGWTRGKVYAKGSTVCDGTVYECLDATLCSTVVPGATDSGAVWLDQTGVLSLPGSQVIDPQFFQYNFEYESGDMVISEHDKRTYKCVDLNTPATLCNDDAPFENSYWEMVSYKPSMPRITNDDGSDGGMQFPVYVDFLNSNRYVLGDYISNSNDNEVFVCQLEAFCQDDPISTVGSIGWSLTQYAVPDNSELSEPSVRFYTEYAGSTDRVQVWIEGDIALSEDGNYYFCNYAPGCRASMVGVSTTNNLEWRIYEAPTGTVFEDPECTAAQILAEEECYMMPTEVQRCVEFDAAETYTVKDIVCTPGNHDGIDFPSYDFPTQSDVTSARRYDSVWRCIDADLCSGQTPSTASAWQLTRQIGLISLGEPVNWYDFALNWPYARGEHVIQFERLYECTNNRGWCSFYSPDQEFEAYRFTNNTASTSIGTIPAGMIINPSVWDEVDEADYFSANLTSIGQFMLSEGAETVSDFGFELITQPWLPVTDRIVGDEVMKTYEQVQACNNFTASVPYYEPQLDPLEGYHHFIAGEFACVREFVWECLDENCNDIRPDVDSLADSWEILGVWADLQVGNPYVVECEFMYNEYTIDEHPSFVAYDDMCDFSDYTAMEQHECRELYNGGINCNNHWKYDTNDVTSTDDEINAAWNITNYGNEVLMLYTGADTYELWWQDEDAENGIDEGFVVAECYDWETAVDPHSKRYWLFETATLACDTQVSDSGVEFLLNFVCIDEALCQDTKPTTDLRETVWLLLPRIAEPVIPTYLPIIDCYDGWTEGYPYMTNDAICGESEGIRDMFFCRDPVQCSMHEPTYNDVMFQHHTWANKEEHIRGNELAYPEDIPMAECEEYRHVVSWNPNTKMTFDLGDEICDRGRLFTCVDVEACNYLSPYAAYLEKREAWRVEWVQPTIMSSAPTFTYTDELAGFVNGTTEYCGEKSRMWTDYNLYDGKSLENYDGDEIFYISDDKLCTVSEFHARTMVSQRTAKEFSINKHFNIDEFIGTRVDNYQKIKSGLWWTEENTRIYEYWNDIMTEYDEGDITLDQVWRHVEENPDLEYSWKNADYYNLPDRIHESLTGWQFDLVTDSNLTYYNARNFDNDEIALFYGTDTWRHKEMPHNLQVIQSVITEGELHYWLGKGGFTSEDFMMAVSKFPAFCGETWDGADLVETCRRELALFFTWMRYDDTYKPWGEYRDYESHVCARDEAGWSCDGDCELAGWENVEMICTAPDGTIYDGYLEVVFDDDGFIQSAYNGGVSYTCTDRADETPELICFSPPVECYDISDNSELGCYADKDWVQFDWSYAGDYDCVEDLIQGKDTNCRFDEDNDYSRNKYQGMMSILDTWEENYWLALRKQTTSWLLLFGDDRPYDYMEKSQTTKPWYSLAHTFSFYMAQPNAGAWNADPHTVAIGRFADWAMPYDHETGLTSKSIFEQVMCSFMADEFGTCWDQKYGVHMDIWRDTYIWNSMITDNDYEENGSDSEFEWFEPKNFDWDPEDSDFVGYYDEHHYMNINYSGCSNTVGDYDDTLVSVAGAIEVCEYAIYDEQEAYDHNYVDHYCQEEWYPFVTNDYGNQKFCAGNLVDATSDNFRYAAYYECTGSHFFCNMVAPEDDSNGDYWNLVTGVDVHAAYWDLNWVEEMACLDFQKLVDGEYQIGLDWLYMYISDLPICHGGMVWECMNNEWDLGSDVMACFHEIPGQATADNYSENWMLWPSKHQLVPMEVTDNFDQYWIDTYETVQWETLDDFDNHFNAHYNDYLVGKDLDDVRYCLPAVMDFPYRLPRHEPMSRRQGDGWHSTNKYQGHYVNDGRKSMNAEIDSLGRLCFNRDMNGKLSQMQVNTIDMIEGMTIDYSFTVDGEGNREIPENQARAAQVLNQTTFELLFPNAQFIADYDSLMNAIGYMPSICSDNVNKRITDDVEACKYELAAFLAKTFWDTMGNPEELETTQEIFESTNTDWFDLGLMVLQNPDCFDPEDASAYPACGDDDYFTNSYGYFMRYSAYEYEDLVANFHERGAGRMWHVANYFDFARQIATDAWMLNPEVITSNHELSWLSALFMWASPIEDQYIFQRHYSAHQIINERIPLSRGEIDALVDHGFGRFLAFDNAALCGYYSYEQDLIVGFFHRALAAMDFDETLSNGDRDWCKQQQYRNVDYENFPDIQDGDFIMWTATDFMLEFQFQMDDECNIMDYDEVYGTVVPPSSWWWHPEGSIMALGEPDQFRFTMPADIIQCALGDEDDHIELNKAPVKIHNQNCDDDYWGTYCTNEHQIVLYWDEDMDDHFGESGEYPTISYHVEMHDGPMDEDGVLSDDGWYTHRSNWRQLGIKIREGIVPNHVYHIRVTREISSAATYGDDSWNTHQGFAVTTARIPQAVYNLRVVETDESEEPLRMHNSTDIDRISVQWDTPYSGGSDIIMYYVSVVRPATSNDYDKVRSEVPDMWDYDSISWSTDNSELVWFQTETYFKLHAGFINVDPDSEIVVDIRAYNKIGYSDRTSFSVYNGRRPDAPVDLEEDEIEHSHNETIQFSWNHGDDGGSDIVQDNVWWNQGETIDEWEFFESVDPEEMMFTTDLGVHGEWHDFMISSENFRYGESSWRWSGTYSDIIQIHKSREPWNAANSEAVLSLEDDTITITWEDDYDGGADINGYWVKLYDVWLDYWVIYARPLHFEYGQYEMGEMLLYGQQIIAQSWLRYGDEVKFSIRPNNMHGEATNEQEAICENVLMMLPSPPMHLREVASETTQNYITWTWDLPQSAAWHTFGDIHFNTAQLRNLPQYWDGGSPILSYRVAVYSQTDDAYEFADAEMQEYDVTSPMQLTKYYTRGQWYDVQMYSTNLFGESAEYSEISILQAQVPWAITDGETSQLIYAGMYNGVEDTSAKKNFVRFRWFDNNNGGVPITDYHVQVFAEDQETGFDTASCSGLEIDGSGTTSCYVSIFDLTDTAGQWGFTWGQNVTFRVRAYNEKGWSLWSDVLGGTSIYYKADPPTALTIDHLLTEADYIYLSWTAPTEDNGSDITEYEVYKNQASNPTVWTLIYQTEEVFQEITEFIIPCQEYNFTVTSMNGYGESDLAAANATEVPMSKPENFTVAHTYADPALEGDFFPNEHTFTFTFPDYTDTDVSGGCAIDEIRGFWGETGEDGAPGLAGYPMMNITVTEGVPGNDSIVIDADMWEVGYNESITYGTDFGQICFTFGYGDKNLECIVGSTQGVVDNTTGMLIVPPQEWAGKPIANADNSTLDYLTSGMMVNLPTAATANSTMGGEDFLGYYLQLTDENRTTNIGSSPQVANADFPYSLTDDAVSVGDTVCAVAIPYNSVGTGDATDALVYKCQKACGVPLGDSIASLTFAYGTGDTATSQCVTVTAAMIAAAQNGCDLTAIELHWGASDGTLTKISNITADTPVCGTDADDFDDVDAGDDIYLTIKMTNAVGTHYVHYTGDPKTEELLPPDSTDGTLFTLDSGSYNGDSTWTLSIEYTTTTNNNGGSPVTSVDCHSGSFTCSTKTLTTADTPGEFISCTSSSQPTAYEEDIVCWETNAEGPSDAGNFTLSVVYGCGSEDDQSFEGYLELSGDPTATTVDLSYLQLEDTGDFDWYLEVSFETVPLSDVPAPNETPDWTTNVQTGSDATSATITGLTPSQHYIFHATLRNDLHYECYIPDDTASEDITYAYASTADWDNVAAPTGITVTPEAHYVDISWDADLAADQLGLFQLVIFYDDCAAVGGGDYRRLVNEPNDGAGAYFVYDPTFYTDTDYIDDDLTTAEFVDGAYPTYTYNQTKEFFNYSNETEDLTDGVSTSDICVCVVGGDSFRCGETATVTYVAAAAPAPVEGVVGFFVGDLLWLDWMDGQIAAQEASTPLICETNQYKVTLILPDDTEIVDDTYCLGDIAIANHLCAFPVDRLTDEHGFAECDQVKIKVEAGCDGAYSAASDPTDFDWPVIPGSACAAGGGGAE